MPGNRIVPLLFSISNKEYIRIDTAYQVYINGLLVPNNPEGHKLFYDAVINWCDITMKTKINKASSVNRMVNQMNNVIKEVTDESNKPKEGDKNKDDNSTPESQS